MQLLKLVEDVNKIVSQKETLNDKKSNGFQRIEKSLQKKN